VVRAAPRDPLCPPIHRPVDRLNTLRRAWSRTADGPTIVFHRPTEGLGPPWVFLFLPRDSRQTKVISAGFQSVSRSARAT
jgi:hypothetical protein